MIKVKEAIIVEGKYDKIKLSNFIDGLIITTDGFGVFKDKEKPEWNAIRDHIQAMFNMMFMLELKYKKMYNYKSYGERYASDMFSGNTTMQLFSEKFGFNLNTKELEKIKESQKKTNEIRKGERKYVSPHKRTTSYDENELSSENTQSYYD